MPDCLANVFDVYVNVRSVLHNSQSQTVSVSSYRRAVTANQLALGFQK